MMATATAAARAVGSRSAAPAVVGAVRSFWADVPMAPKVRPDRPHFFQPPDASIAFAPRRAHPRGLGRTRAYPPRLLSCPGHRGRFATLG